MIKFQKTAAMFLAALAIGGAALTAAGEAQARPGRGGHGGGHGWGHHRPHHGWGHHRPHWRGYGIVAPVAYLGTRCRLVERVNRYGDVVLRRVCARPIYY